MDESLLDYALIYWLGLTPADLVDIPVHLKRVLVDVYLSRGGGGM